MQSMNGMNRRVGTWEMMGYTALLGTGAALAPNSETLSVATGIAALSLVINPVRRWLHNRVHNVPLLGFSTRSTLHAAGVAFVGATAGNAIVDGGTFDGDHNIIDASQAAINETYTDGVVPTWNALDDVGDTVKLPFEIALNAFAIPRIQNGFVGRAIDIIEFDVSKAIRQGLSPDEEIERPSSFDLFD